MVSIVKTLLRLFCAMELEIQNVKCHPSCTRTGKKQPVISATAVSTKRPRVSRTNTRIAPIVHSSTNFRRCGYGNPHWLCVLLLTRRRVHLMRCAPGLDSATVWGGGSVCAQGSDDGTRCRGGGMRTLAEQFG